MEKPNMVTCSLAAVRGKFLACLLLPLTMFLGCTPQDKPSQQVSRPVKVARIGVEAAAGMTSFAGEVKARHETILSFRVGGKLLARPVDVGDRVRKGTLLARLDQSDYRLVVRNLEAQHVSAIADQSFLGDELTRYRELLAQRVISPPEFDRHETAYITARERVTGLESQLGQASNQLAYTDLLADRDGVVTVLEVETGQVVSAGQAIAKLAPLDTKEIHFDIPEHRLPELKRQQEISVTLWASGERRFKARVREIAATADPASRTYRVKATLLDGQKAAELGMTATVWIASDLSARIAIPFSSVFTTQDEPGQPRVWLVNEQASTVHSVPVQIGETLDGELTVVSGLGSGQLVVSAGVQRLLEGQVVRVPEEIFSAVRERDERRSVSHE